MQDAVYHLPFDIEVEALNGRIAIESNLGEVLGSTPEDVRDSLRVVGVIEGIEHLLMALAQAGANLSEPVFAEAVEHCVSQSA